MATHSALAELLLHGISRCGFEYPGGFLLLLLALEADSENSTRSRLLDLATWCCLCRCCLTSIETFLWANCARSYFPSPSNLQEILQHGCWFLKGFWCWVMGSQVQVKLCVWTVGSRRKKQHAKTTFQKMILCTEVSLLSILGSLGNQEACKKRST